MYYYLGGMKMDEELRKINERLDLIEFRQKLLFENTNTSRFLFETGITRKQYEDIMDVMDEYREKIEKKENVTRSAFEKRIYDVSGFVGDYHFCEEIAKVLMEDGRWTEVFPALYGSLEKYKNYMDRYKND